MQHCRSYDFLCLIIFKTQTIHVENIKMLQEFIRILIFKEHLKPLSIPK